MTKQNPKAIDDIYKKYGESAIFKLGANSKLNVDAISTGDFYIDRALGVGGIPRGRVTEIYGPEASGKTTLALHVVASAQAMGLLCAFVDVEHALDPVYARAVGVDTDELFVSQPDYGEQALDIVDMLAAGGDFGLIVVDSVAALTPKAELEGEMTDHNVGSHARLMSRAMRKMTANISRTHTTVVFINQLREKVGVMFGNPETTPGGRALRYYSSVRIDVRKKDNQNSGGEIVGNDVKVKIAKNKVAPPFKEVIVTIYYGEGISGEMSLLRASVEAGILEKSGAWFTLGGTRVQGWEAARVHLKQNPDIAKTLRDTLESLE